MVTRKLSTDITGHHIQNLLPRFQLVTAHMSPLQDRQQAIKSDPARAARGFILAVPASVVLWGLLAYMCLG